MTNASLLAEVSFEVPLRQELLEVKGRQSDRDPRGLGDLRSSDWLAGSSHGGVRGTARRVLQDAETVDGVLEGDVVGHRGSHTTATTNTKGWSWCGPDVRL